MRIQSPADLMRAAYRTSLHGDVVTTLDMTEGVHRQLGKLSSGQLGLGFEEYERLAALAKTAYETLCAMQAITDERGDDA